MKEFSIFEKPSIDQLLYVPETLADKDGNLYRIYVHGDRNIVLDLIENYRPIKEENKS